MFTRIFIFKDLTVDIMNCYCWMKLSWIYNWTLKNLQLWTMYYNCLNATVIYYFCNTYGLLCFGSCLFRALFYNALRDTDRLYLQLFVSTSSVWESNGVRTPLLCCFITTITLEDQLRQDCFILSHNFIKNNTAAQTLACSGCIYFTTRTTETAILRRLRC